MSDNLNNEIKRPLFADGSIIVTTDGGDITPTLVQPAQSTNTEKYNLDQRDDLTILVYAILGTVTAGAVLTVKYYNRVPNAITDAVLLATETKTLAEITVGNYLATEFTSTALELADYFTVETTLKQAVGNNYTVTANVIVKKKIVDEPLINQATPVSETKASLTVQTALKLEAKLLGTLGNNITVKAVSSGVAGMSISNLTGAGTQADPYLIEIKLGTTTTNNTMTLIAAAIAAKTDVAAIVNTVVVAGATQMTVFTVVPLTGGLNGSVGYKGEVIFDADGTKWELKYITTGCYYWCPDGFPAVNTPYYSHYDKSLGMMMQKMLFSGTSGAVNTQTIIPTVLQVVTDIFIISGWLATSAVGEKTPISIGNDKGATSFNISGFAFINGFYSLVTFCDNLGYLANKPFKLIINFTA